MSPNEDTPERRLIEKILADSRAESDAWEQHQSAKAARARAEQAWWDARMVCSVAREKWRATLTPEAKELVPDEDP